MVARRIYHALGGFSPPLSVVQLNSIQSALQLSSQLRDRAQQGRGAKFCSDSHKEMAYRQRREATVQALIGDLGIEEAGAVEMVERIGMQRIVRYRRGRGYQDNDSLRRWLVPRGVDVMQG